MSPFSSRHIQRKIGSGPSHLSLRPVLIGTSRRRLGLFQEGADLTGNLHTNEVSSSTEKAWDWQCDNIDCWAFLGSVGCGPEECTPECRLGCPPECDDGCDPVECPELCDDYCGPLANDLKTSGKKIVSETDLNTYVNANYTDPLVGAYCKGTLQKPEIKIVENAEGGVVQVMWDCPIQ